MPRSPLPSARPPACAAPAASLRLPRTTNTTRAPSDLHRGGGGDFPCPNINLTRLPSACLVPAQPFTLAHAASPPPRCPAPARLNAVRTIQGSAEVLLFPRALDLRPQSRTAPLQIPPVACPRRPPASQTRTCIPLRISMRSFTYLPFLYLPLPPTESIPTHSNKVYVHYI
ncbi:hypothetical protein B0H16DRAFT_427824 [Mycena metata]|uniref:Uncharacterized protein n=1 Tax=Mycena metata TaxID=1033252 RepID=A0AAD7JKZ7_9AGAR|nr:hypothetical protein B0H16DRAFT_427824 [Mycena metata]